MKFRLSAEFVTVVHGSARSKSHAKILTLRAYEIDRPASAPVTVPLPRTAKSAAKNTMAFPITSSRIASHLQTYGHK